MLLPILFDICRKASRQALDIRQGRIPGTPVMLRISYLFLNEDDQWEKHAVCVTRWFLFDQEGKDRGDLTREIRAWSDRWAIDAEQNCSLKAASIEMFFYSNPTRSVGVCWEFSARYRLFEVWDKLPYEKVLSGLGISDQKNQSISSWLGQRRKEGILDKKDSTTTGSTWFVTDRSLLIEQIKKIGLRPLNQSQIQLIKDRARAMKNIKPT